MTKIKMKTLKFFIAFLIMAGFTACSSDDDNNALPSTKSSLNLQFKNYVQNDLIQLGDANSYTTTDGETVKFTELKYVISNVVLVTNKGTEVPYHVDNLDDGAQVVNLGKTESLNFKLSDIPTDQYKQVKFILGVKPELNELDQSAFPGFYAEAGANDTEMMWEWGNGYRFVKVEGFYGQDDQIMSIHTGSTLKNVDPDQVTNPDPDLEKEEGIDASREVVLNLPQNLEITGDYAPTIVIKADLDHLFDADIFVLNDKLAIIHTAAGVAEIMDNLGGDGETNHTGMFSILQID